MKHSISVDQWFRRLCFLVGCSMVVGFAWFLARVDVSGVGMGTVIRHNLDNGIDATPLFYTEVENMSTLERGLDRHSEKRPNQEKRFQGHDDQNRQDHHPRRP